MNAGQTLSVNAKLLTPACSEWLAFVASRYGDQAWADNTTITGFATSGDLTGATSTVQLVQEQIAKTTSPVLWFEQAFNAEATTLSQTNAAPLLTGDTSPETFMAQIQAALDK
jgi:raffinose/stachyose/melibiose transport system substrate-binding protein